MVTLNAWVERVDGRLRASLLAEATQYAPATAPLLPKASRVVLVGHRAAGKSTVLPMVAKLLGRRAFDLDAELESGQGRSVSEWVTQDEAGFRRGEREVFTRLPVDAVVAVGGGFWSHHADLFSDAVVVQVPVSFETYCERLRADPRRPRLLPQQSFEDELKLIFEKREAIHKQHPCLSWVEFWFRQQAGFRPKRLVTLPPQVDAAEFAERARRAGADALEVRTDLTPLETDLKAAAQVLPLWVAERENPLPPEWVMLASGVDRPKGLGRPALTSFHADRPLNSQAALAEWEGFGDADLIKHVEPLGASSRFPEVLRTQSLLIERFGEGRVTVLVTGATAQPFRSVLARRNALDYLALDAGFSAAPGQRLLEDAVREYQAPMPREERLGIIGSDVRHSRSPRIHARPFDRIQWPESTDVEPLLEAMRPYYRGLAVTHPFKTAVAKAVESSLPAVNTLWRERGRWRADNTDVEGARKVLEVLQAATVTVLGDGGSAQALRLAAAQAEVQCRVVRRADLGAMPLSGACVWTWPPSLPAPEGLRFEGATVAVIAYGPPGRVVKQQIVERGGRPLMLGHRWLVAQARGQRKLWGE